MSEPLPVIEVYSRPGCHLCEVLLETLEPLVMGQLALEVRNIDTRDDWRATYDTRVPVVRFDGQDICQYALDKPAILRILDGLTSRNRTS